MRYGHFYTHIYTYNRFIKKIDLILLHNKTENMYWHFFSVIYQRNNITHTSNTCASLSTIVKVCEGFSYIELKLHNYIVYSTFKARV